MWRVVRGIELVYVTEGGAYGGLGSGGAGGCLWAEWLGCWVLLLLVIIEVVDAATRRCWCGCGCW